MKALGKALLVLLSVGVAAPAAARPRVPPGPWPGVSDVLRNLNVAAPVSARPLAVPVTAWLGLTDLPVAAVSTERAMWCGDSCASIVLMKCICITPSPFTTWLMPPSA